MNKKYLIGVTLFLLGFVPVVADANSLGVMFDEPEQIVNEGQEFRIPIMLENPDHVAINTVQATVILPKQAFSISSYWFEHSLVSLWIEEPTMRETDSAYYISFTGLIPGGTDEAGEVLTLVVDALEPVERATIHLLDPLVYKNNHTAEQVTLPDQYLFVRIVPYDAGLVPQQEVVVEDAVPPENFFPIVGKSNTVYDDAYFVMFQTIDRQTGIDRYEVLESTHFYSNDELEEHTGSSLYWRSATNPMQLQDQSLSSYIYVRAYDRAGNSRTVIIPPVVFVEKMLLSCILVVGAIGLLLVLGLAFRRWLKNRRSYPVYDALEEN